MAQNTSSQQGMSTLLIASPYREFGQGIAEWAQEIGQKAFTATNKAEAVVLAHDEGCTLALLDDAFGEQYLREVGEALRLVIPEIALTILQGEKELPPFPSLRPYTLLQKPLTKKAFLAFLHGEISPASPVSPPKAELDGKDWLGDANRAARHLTQLTLESAAQAAMLLRQGRVWAYAGQLSQEAIGELERLIEHMAQQKGGDILRFIHLNQTRAEHLIYITHLEEEIILALVFEAETPFSVLRAQATRLKALLDTETASPAPKEATPAAPSSAPTPSETFSSGADELEHDESVAFPPISAILGEVPEPEPQPARDSSPSALIAAKEKENEPVVLDESTVQSTVSRQPSVESSPAIPLTQIKSQGMSLIDTLAETRRHEPDALAQTQKSKKAEREAIETPDALGETRPHTPQEAVEYGLEPISPARAHLNFACLLIPRFDTHHLTGDLATRLAEWVSSICVAYGWRLEYISIRPEYLQWVVSVPPSTSPGVLIRTIRMKTSEYIFAEFPRLRRENPSGDFWAPGYLIMGSNQPHPPQLVRNYILETRRHQGISRPRR